jgi:hypothetical protein
MEFPRVSELQEVQELPKASELQEVQGLPEEPEIPVVPEVLDVYELPVETELQEVQELPGTPELPEEHRRIGDCLLPSYPSLTGRKLVKRHVMYTTVHQELMMTLVPSHLTSNTTG